MIKVIVRLDNEKTCPLLLESLLVKQRLEKEHRFYVKSWLRSLELNMFIMMEKRIGGVFTSIWGRLRIELKEWFRRYKGENVCFYIRPEIL